MKKRIIILNRWADEYATCYSKVFDKEHFDLLFVTTQDCVDVISKGHLQEIKCVDRLDFQTLQPVVKSILEKWGPVSHFIALSEYDIQTAAEIREHFDICGDKSIDVASWRDKHIMKSKVKAAGLRVPKWFAVSSKDEALSAFAELGSPAVVLKPRAEAGSKGVTICHDMADFSKAILEIGEAITDYEVEEFIEARIGHIDGILQNGKVWFAKASLYLGTCFRFREGDPLGSVFVADPTRHEQLIGFAHKCLQALNLENGAFHLEFFDTADPIFLEMGARVGGGEIPFLIEKVCGVDLVSSWLSTLGGLVLDPPRERHEGIGGFLMIPEPQPWPMRLVATKLEPSLGNLTELMSLTAMDPGHVFDGKGGYELIGLRAIFSGQSVAAVEAAINNTLSNLILELEPCQFDQSSNLKERECKKTYTPF